MSFDLYLTFAAASAVLILIPGPAVTVIVANALAHGAGRALVTVAGTSSAILAQLIILTLGLSPLLGLLSDWFEGLRWAGVAYLVYLGLRKWSEPQAPAGSGALSPIAARRLYWQGFVVNATNPKTLAFYAAFFPQFIDPARPAMAQLALLSFTFLVIATLIDGSYALAGERLGAWLRGAARTRLRNRLSGGLLIGAGLGLALVRRG